MTERLRTAIKFTINELTQLIKSTPEELLASIDRGTFTDIDENPNSTTSSTRDAIYIIESLQETLNLVLDARKRLIQLGLYNLGDTNAERKGSGFEMEIRVRDSIPQPLEEDEDTDCHATYVPPDTSVEV